jgi:hypothetical protein
MGRVTRPIPSASITSNPVTAWTDRRAMLQSLGLTHHDQAAHERARRRYDGLHAKAASTGFPEERPTPAPGQGRAAPRQVRPVGDDGRIVTRPSTEQGERYGSYAHPSGMPTPRW